jgi:hypothetical protein
MRHAHSSRSIGSNDIIETQKRRQAECLALCDRPFRFARGAQSTAASSPAEVSSEIGNCRTESGMRQD